MRPGNSESSGLEESYSSESPELSNSESQWYKSCSDKFNLGESYLYEGSTSEAVEIYKEAIDLFEEIGQNSDPNLHDLILFFGNVAFSYFDIGEEEKATGVLDSVNAIFKEIGENNFQNNEAQKCREMAKWWAELGRAYPEVDRDAEVPGAYMKAIKSIQNLDPKQWTDEDYREMANYQMGFTACMEEMEVLDIIEHYLSALAVYSQISKKYYEDLEGEARCRIKLAGFYKENNYPLEAKKHFHEIKNLLEHISENFGSFSEALKEYESKVNSFFSKWARWNSEVDDLRRHFNGEGNGSIENELNFLGRELQLVAHGNKCRKLGRWEEAIEGFEEAILLCKQIPTKSEADLVILENSFESLMLVSHRAIEARLIDDNWGIVKKIFYRLLRFYIINFKFLVEVKPLNFDSFYDNFENLNIKQDQSDETIFTIYRTIICIFTNDEEVFINTDVWNTINLLLQAELYTSNPELRDALNLFSSALGVAVGNEKPDVINPEFMVQLNKINVLNKIQVQMTVLKSRIDKISEIHCEANVTENSVDAKNNVYDTSEFLSLRHLALVSLISESNKKNRQIEELRQKNRLLKKPASGKRERVEDQELLLEEEDEKKRKLSESSLEDFDDQDFSEFSSLSF